MSVCSRVGSELNNPPSLSLSLSRSEARSDYEYFARIIEIGACQIEACFDIVLIDDFTVEKAVEEFTVLLSHGVNEDLNDRIRIPNPTKMLSILDVDCKFSTVGA